jgi:methylmalonyl-CoA mutase N-terminal domain/subunit
VVRAALAALAALSGGADGVDASPLAEAGGLPEDRGSILAELVTQAIIHESGIAARPDPFGGSYFVEHLTAVLERRALELIGPAEGLPPRER